MVIGQELDDDKYWFVWRTQCEQYVHNVNNVHNVHNVHNVRNVHNVNNMLYNAHNAHNVHNVHNMHSVDNAYTMWTICTVCTMYTMYTMWTICIVQCARTHQLRLCVKLRYITRLLQKSVKKVLFTKWWLWSAKVCGFWKDWARLRMSNEKGYQHEPSNWLLLNFADTNVQSDLAQPVHFAKPKFLWDGG